MIKSAPIGIVGFLGHGKDTVADIIMQEIGYTKQPFAGPLKDFCKAIFNLDDMHLTDRKLKETPLCHLWGFDTRSGFRAGLPAALAKLISADPKLMTLAAEGTDMGVQDLISGLSVSDLYKTVTDRLAIYVEPLIFTGDRAALSPTPRILLQVVGTEVFRAIHTKFWTRIWKARAAEQGWRVVTPDARFLTETDVIKECGGFLIRVDASGRLGHVDTSKLHGSEKAIPGLPTHVTLFNDGTVLDLARNVVETLESRGFITRKFPTDRVLP